MHWKSALKEAVKDAQLNKSFHNLRKNTCKLPILNKKKTNKKKINKWANKNIFLNILH